MRDAGFSRPAFETIVASGPNSVLPHAPADGSPHSGGRSYRAGFGGVYDGYSVDLTRTVSLGPLRRPCDNCTWLWRRPRKLPSPPFGRVSASSAIDAAARRVLDQYAWRRRSAMDRATAWASRYTRSPGSLENPPDFRIKRSSRALVFTIEPGAYVVGVGGVRLETTCS